MKNRRIVRLVIPACASLVLLAGCSPAEMRWHQYRADLTPNMDNMSRVKQQIDNDWAIYSDTSWRQYHEDMARFWLLDRPSRLDPRPIPY